MKSAKGLMQAAGASSRALASAKRREELAFLPAALELVETPPSPIGRAIGGTIIAIFCAALAWAAIGKVDIVATATGKIVPNGRSKVIQPFETGVVRTIYVHDGQIVKAGEPLIALDATMNQADAAHQRSDLLAEQLEIARLTAALSGAADPLTEFHPPPGADPAMVQTERQTLISQTAEQKAKLAALDGQIAEKEAERATAQASISKLQAQIPIVAQQAELYNKLAESGYGSKVQLLNAQLNLVDQKKELAVTEGQYRQAQQSIAALQQTRNQTMAEYSGKAGSELATAQQKAAGIAQDLIKAQERAKLQLLSAPVDGEVQQLAVHTVGGVVTPAQQLLVLVPENGALEIDAMVSNRDIGFVFPGQDVAIKIDAFDFTKYGLFHGKVLSVSEDSIPQQKPPDLHGDSDINGAPSTTSEPKGQELVYEARVSLDRTRLQVDNREVNLTPGMAVTTEIKTGSQRIIDYLLSPLLRVKADSLHER